MQQSAEYIKRGDSAPDSLVFPEGTPEEAADLVKLLLRPSPFRRIGASGLPGSRHAEVQARAVLARSTSAFSLHLGAPETDEYDKVTDDQATRITGAQGGHSKAAAGGGDTGTDEQDESATSEAETHSSR